MIAENVKEGGQRRPAVFKRIYRASGFYRMFLLFSLSGVVFSAEAIKYQKSSFYS